MLDVFTKGRIIMYVRMVIRAKKVNSYFLFCVRVAYHRQTQTLSLRLRNL